MGGKSLVNYIGINDSYHLVEAAVDQTRPKEDLPDV